MGLDGWLFLCHCIRLRLCLITQKRHNMTHMSHDVQYMRQICMQVITCKARIKYVALLNVLFYKWLGYPAGISGWHCAAVTTAISNLRMSEHGGLSSKVKCQMLSIPTHREGPGPRRGLGGSEALLLGWWWKKTITELPLLWSTTVVTSAMTTILTSVYLFYI